MNSENVVIYKKHQCNLQCECLVCNCCVGYCDYLDFLEKERALEIAKLGRSD